MKYKFNEQIKTIPSLSVLCAEKTCELLAAAFVFLDKQIINHFTERHFDENVSKSVFDIKKQISSLMYTAHEMAKNKTVLFREQSQNFVHRLRNEIMMIIAPCVTIEQAEAGSIIMMINASRLDIDIQRIMVYETRKIVNNERAEHSELIIDLSNIINIDSSGKNSLNIKIINANTNVKDLLASVRLI